ncbi:hypothetical protein Ahy_B01g054543 [Arachis hypogaea]|uniref:Uncharacterized protein n=1 Tax=Arachis hypogaea TaxID=3818 RepID=A0A445AU16_ARAHY|nr:hypothetical protein Ahy_B01g054543 [Arachis hypogaea]
MERSHCEEVPRVTKETSSSYWSWVENGGKKIMIGLADPKLWNLGVEIRPPPIYFIANKAIATPIKGVVPHPGATLPYSEFNGFNKAPTVVCLGPDLELLSTYDDNAAVVIDQEGNPKGTRIFGAIARELRQLATEDGKRETLLKGETNKPKPMRDLVIFFPFFIHTTLTLSQISREQNTHPSSLVPATHHPQIPGSPPLIFTVSPHTTPEPSLLFPAYHSQLQNHRSSSLLNHFAISISSSLRHTSFFHRCYRRSRRFHQKIGRKKKRKTKPNLPSLSTLPSLPSSYTINQERSEKREPVRRWWFTSCVRISSVSTAAGCSACALSPIVTAGGSPHLFVLRLLLVSGRSFSPLLTASPGIKDPSSRGIYLRQATAFQQSTEEQDNIEDDNED